MADVKKIMAKEMARLRAKDMDEEVERQESYLRSKTYLFKQREKIEIETAERLLPRVYPVLLQFAHNIGGGVSTNPAPTCLASYWVHDQKKNFWGKFPDGSGVIYIEFGVPYKYDDYYEPACCIRFNFEFTCYAEKLPPDNEIDEWFIKVLTKYYHNAMKSRRTRY
jgi:hypothetical protein